MVSLSNSRKYRSAMLRLKMCLRVLFLSSILLPGLLRADSGSTPVVTETGNAMLVRITTPNDAGVSINWMSELITNGKDLRLVNTRGLNANLNTGEADAIVLGVENIGQAIELSGKISLVGKAADVILLAPPGGSILCDGCDFEAIPKLIMATGTVTTSNAYIDSIDVGAGNIRVGPNGLRAQDTMALDILGVNIQVDGLINTQLNGAYLGNELQINEQGNITIASGAVNLIQGVFVQEYITGSLGQINYESAGSLNISAQGGLSAGDVHVEATGKSVKLAIFGDITTDSDRILASIHRGQNVIPLKRVRLRALDDIELFGEISGARVDLESARSLYLLQNADREPAVVTKEVNINVALDVINHGVINGDKIQIAADRISNQGEIWADVSAFLSADRVLNNHYGGNLIARELTISSNGVVTNGSDKSYFLDSDIPGIHAFNDLPDLYSLNEGTVLDESGQVVNLVSAPDLSAAIIGLDIDIRTRRMRNINPYSTDNATNNADLSLDPGLASQVLLSAEGKLIIRSDESIENTSAIIEGAQSFHFDTRSLLNDRFKIVTGTRPADDVPLDACIQLKSCYLQSNVTVGITGTEGFFKYISPAARILGNSDASQIRLFGKISG